MNDPLSPAARNHGFTLIEVLVAIVVLAIGVLGVAALQTKSLSQGQGSLQATQAVALAYDYADRIRANPCGAYEGLYEISQTSLPTSAPSKTCYGSTATTCTSAADLAAWDRYDWYTNQLKKKLPAGSTAIVACSDGTSCSSSNYTTCGVTPNPPQTIMISVYWTQKGGINDMSQSGLTAANCGTSAYDSTQNLPCVNLSVQP